MLMQAAEIAISNRLTRHEFDYRNCFLGAVGARNDGVIVSSRNLHAVDIAPDHHAEARLAKKLTPNSTVWVARVLRRNGEWALARPCASCERKLRSCGVRKVVYTIAPNEWGVMVLTK